MLSSLTLLVLSTFLPTVIELLTTHNELRCGQCGAGLLIGCSGYGLQLWLGIKSKGSCSTVRQHRRRQDLQTDGPRASDGPEGHQRRSPNSNREVRVGFFFCYLKVFICLTVVPTLPGRKVRLEPEGEPLHARLSPTVCRRRTWTARPDRTGAPSPCD